MLIPRLMLATLCIAALTGCKPRSGLESMAKDINISQREVVVEVPEGVVYVNPNEFEETKPGQPNPANEDIDSAVCLVGDSKADRTLTVAEQIKQLTDLLAADLKIDKDTSIPENEKRLRVLPTIRSEIKSQLYFLTKNTVAADGNNEKLDPNDLKFAAGKFNLESVEVIQQQPGLEIAVDDGMPALTEGKAKTFIYLGIRYRLKTKGLVPNKYTMDQPIRARGYVPHIMYEEFLTGAMGHFANCIEKPTSGTVGPNNFFNYLNPSKCAFEQLNAGNKFFTPTTVTISKANVSNSSKSPEYNRIWEDDRLVATFIFGKVGYEGEVSKVDAGTTAYRDFLKKLNNLDTITIQNDNRISEFNHRLTGKVKGGWFTKTKVIDIQVLHLNSITEIKEDLAPLIFGDRIGPSDLFVYNGHSGYGNNIKYIEKLVKPHPDQFVLLYLNGCNTYSYQQFNNPNYDVISNGKETYFTHMTAASLATLNGLIKGSTYVEILREIPQAGCPTVSGEDVPSVKP